MFRLFGLFLLFLFFWYLLRGIQLLLRSVRIVTGYSQDARQTFTGGNRSSTESGRGLEKDITSRVRIIDENSTVDR